MWDLFDEIEGQTWYINILNRYLIIILNIMKDLLQQHNYKKNYLINLVKYIIKVFYYIKLWNKFIFVTLQSRKNMVDVLKFVYIMFLFIYQFRVVPNNESTLFIIF